MPHALVLIFGDTVRAAEAFDKHIDPEVPRIILVDTFKDEAEESLRVADALGDRLWGVRLDTPSERGRVTPELVRATDTAPVLPTGEPGRGTWEQDDHLTEPAVPAPNRAPAPETQPGQ